VPTCFLVEMTMTSYERPEPHPIFSSIGDRVPREPLSTIEGYVCPGPDGVLCLVPDLSMRSRFEIAEDVVLYVESDAGTGGRVRVFVPEAAAVTVRQFADEDVTVAAGEVMDAQGARGGSDTVALALAVGDGFGAEGAGLDCSLRCQREKRRCEGLFPSPEKTRECAKKYNACRKKCIDKGDAVLAIV
jgi:hypothetical protein